MQKYMFIFQGGGDVMKLTPEELQKNMQQWLNWVDQLKKEGTYLEGEPLEPTGLVVKAKGKVITDGPYVEGKEAVGGYFIVKAHSIEAAAKMAHACPGLEFGGSVEIRPVMAM